MIQISLCVQFVACVILIGLNVLLSMAQSTTDVGAPSPDHSPAGSGSQPKPAWDRDPKE